MTMQALIEAFPNHILESLKLAQEQPLDLTHKSFHQVIVSGLGGSGIGGTILSNWAFGHCPIPLAVNKGYHIPASVNQHTLFIASSYSGNTEETLLATEAAEKAGATILCITSGGILAKMAEDKGWALRKIPGGNPPRACLGYSLTQLTEVFSTLGWLPGDFLEAMRIGADYLKEKQHQLSSQAKAVAHLLQNKWPVIYAESGLEGVAVRFRQQINENAKMLCWHHVVPEMNHNEMVGWADQHPEIVVVNFKSPLDFPRNALRMQIADSIFEQRGASSLNLESTHPHQMVQALELIHLGDWISLHLAHLRGVDEMEVKVIDFLKGELAKP